MKEASAYNSMRRKSELEKIENLKIVVPGEFLGDVREYIAGEGTYVSNGRIYARILGVVIYDTSKKMVCVKPIKSPILPKKNDIVLAEVISSGDSIAQVKIYFVIKRRDKDLRFIPLIPPFSGLIHISQLGTRTESVSTLLKVGDKILGHVTIDAYPPFGVSLVGKSFGVVAARCSICGTPLIYRENDLFCPSCKKRNPRKISPLYNFEKFEELFRKYKEKALIGMEVE